MILSPRRASRLRSSERHTYLGQGHSHLPIRALLSRCGARPNTRLEQIDRYRDQQGTSFIQPTLVGLAQRAGRYLGWLAMVSAHPHARRREWASEPDLPGLQPAVPSVAPALVLPLRRPADGSAA